MHDRLGTTSEGDIRLRPVESRGDEAPAEARPREPLDPEDLYPPRRRISLAASLSLVLVLSLLSWFLLLVLFT